MKQLNLKGIVMSNFTKGPWSVRETGAHWNNPNLINIEINYGTDEECVCDTVYKMSDANLISAYTNSN